MKEEYLKWPWGINDTIENLKEMKKNLQIIALNVNADGMGQQDSQEIGYDFDRAIKALEESRWIPIIERLPRTEEYVLVSFEIPLFRTLHDMKLTKMEMGHSIQVMRMRVTHHMECL